jgi:quercetin dioxygenase-like cupin family protein
MNEEEFRILAKEKGYGEVELIEASPGPDEEMHSHDHSVISVILNGKFTMTTEEGTKVFITGDMCENPAGTMHKEKTGPDGGSFLMAKKPG